MVGLKLQIKVGGFFVRPWASGRGIWAHGFEFNFGWLWFSVMFRAVEMNAG